MGWDHRCSAPLMGRPIERIRRDGRAIQLSWKRIVFSRRRQCGRRSRSVYGRIRPGYNSFMSTNTHPILIGTCGWSYPEWDGVFYSPGMDSADYLSWYADRFPIVEVDSTFYRVPTRRMVLGWRNHTPSGFRFSLKVPQAITHKKQLQDCEKEVEEFVAAIEPLGEKLACALLQLGYFNRQQFASLEALLETLDPFLDSWPHDAVPLALETRNPRWVGTELADVLRRHNTALTLTLQKWMSRPSEVMTRIGAVTGPLSYFRLVGNREATEK